MIIFKYVIYFLPSAWWMANDAIAAKMNLMTKSTRDRVLGLFRQLKFPSSPVKTSSTPTLVPMSSLEIPKKSFKNISSKVRCSKEKKSLKKSLKSGKSLKYTNCQPTSSPIVTSSPVPTESPSSNPTVLETRPPTISIKPSARPTIAPTGYNCSSPLGRSLDITNITSHISTIILPGSPQERALSWLLYNDTATNACNGTAHISQRYSLAVFFYSTIGTNWTITDRWLGPANECTWYGVTCTNEFVTSLLLKGNYLAGTLPGEVAALTLLSKFDVAINHINGSIPTQFGLLTGLTEFSVFFNTFHSTLPTELGLLTNLRTLDLERNTFEGQLFFPQLQNTFGTLKYLYGSFNNFVGNIPSWIVDFTHLEEIVIRGNNLTGSIPSEITRLKNLTTCDLKDNQLTGMIPSELGSLIELQEINLSNNKLEGMIPADIENCLHLTILDLSNNSLQGSIPVGVGNLVNLTKLNLGYNLLTGSLTEFVSVSLISVDLTKNFLNGSIPSSFFDRPELSHLYLSYNAFSGNIPSNFGVSMSLETIWLDHNEVTGSVPAIPIPNGWPKIMEVLLQNNSLTGDMPPSICELRITANQTFKALQADCEPYNLVLGEAELNCPNGCCTACFLD